jgi:hypothetical protein
VRFGKSKIAQTTADSAQVTMAALDVAYNPLTLEPYYRASRRLQG